MFYILLNLKFLFVNYFRIRLYAASVADRDAAEEYGKRRIMPESSGHDAASHTNARRACIIKSKC